MVLEALSYEQNKLSYGFRGVILWKNKLSYGFGGVILWKNKLSFGYPMVILWMLSCNRTLPPCFIIAENMIHSKHFQYLVCVLMKLEYLAWRIMSPTWWEWVGATCSSNLWHLTVSIPRCLDLEDQFARKITKL